jgi:hypothetical protein
VRLRHLAAAALTLAGLATAAPAAHAAGFTGPCSTGTGRHAATTTLTGRPDNGGGGQWAADSLTRTLVITGGTRTGSVWTWTGAVCDGGTAVTIPGALAPNQGPGHAGQVIIRRVTATAGGTVLYSFTTNEPLNTSPNLGVPPSEAGAPAVPQQTTSLWFEQAFPAGTAFGGPGVTSYDYEYAAGLFMREAWSETSANGDGQDAGAGQITGIAR